MLKMNPGSFELFVSGNMQKKLCNLFRLSIHYWVNSLVQWRLILLSVFTN